MSPVHEHCYIGYELDVIYIVDNTCGYTDNECEQLMEAVTEMVACVKGNTSPRFGLLQMTDSDPNVAIAISDTQYNDVTLLDPESLYDSTRTQLMQSIQAMTCDGPSTSITNLIAAIDYATVQLSNNRVAGREEKIVIFSSCGDKTNSDQEPTDDDVCTEYGEGIFDDISGDEIEVVVVNVNSSHSDIDDTGTYLNCLTGGDWRRFFTVDDIEDIGIFLSILRISVTKFVRNQQMHQQLILHLIQHQIQQQIQHQTQQQIQHLIQQQIQQQIQQRIQHLIQQQ
eukprot:169875_1